MSRRDTIIVAVLINAGLLIVLFASALKSNAPNTDLIAKSAALTAESPEPIFKKESSYVGGDEVDHALNQLSQHTDTPPSSISSMVAPQVMSPVSSSNFAEDLKALSFSEPSRTPIPPSSAQVTTPMTLQDKPSSEWIEVKVKKGDVLEKIARHHHTTVAEIIKMNKLANTHLHIGQILKIPVKGDKKGETHSIAYTPLASSQTENVINDSSKFYTVKKGDSPWTIAVKNHLKVEELLKLNNMNEEQARRLKPGDQIRIK